ncbi:hypothetical protein D3C78_1664800 [compost metagenome]
MFIRFSTFFIISGGQTEPAITPVLKFEKSYLSKSFTANSAINIVGTPYKEVHFSSETAFSVISGSKLSFGITIQAP